MFYYSDSYSSILPSVYFEESCYRKGHFQSIIPIRNSVTLEAIKDAGGFNVAEHYNFPLLGEFNTVSLPCVFIMIKL